MANRSTFPNTIDVFMERYEISATDKPLLIRFQELKLKTSLTSNESNELANLTSQLRSVLVTAEDFNKLQDAITNLEVFFRDETDGYIQTKQTEINNTVNTATTSIQSTKDSALIAIESKKNNVIEYMDGTTAGALRNDIGVMGELTTVDKTNLVDAINEINAKDVDLTPINDKIGDLTGLSTTAKTNLVAAINEVQSEVNNISLTANNVSITDTGNYYTSTNAEGALQEIGLTLNVMRGSLITSANSVLGS